MAATVAIHEMTGSSAGTNKTSSTGRFKSADETTVDTTNRLSIPGSTALSYSYTKQLRFYFSVGPSVDIQNLRAYSDGTNNFGTGVAIQYDVSSAFGANVRTNIAGTDLFTKTSGSPIDLDALKTGPQTGTGYKGDFLRCQMSIANTASPGTLSAETLTFAYDET